jgi:hypothetical protein
MSRKLAKAHRTIYTIILNRIGFSLILLIANSTIIELLTKRRCQAKQNVLKINQTRYQFHFEAYI